MNTTIDPIRDHFQVRGRRNLAIGIIRQADHTKIAATTRKIKYDNRLLLTILGLRNPS